MCGECSRDAVEGMTRPMLVRTDRVVGLRCPACGKLTIHHVSLFALDRKELSLNCECGFRTVQLARKGRMLCAQVACIVCEETHVVLVPLREVSHSDLFTLCCPHTRVELAYLGLSEGEVSRADLEGLNLNLADMVAKVDESYFADREVMSEALRILERIASLGLLTCECGNERIDLDVYSDKVELMCSVCGSLLLVYAETQADLEPLRNLRSITMQQSEFRCIGEPNCSSPSSSRHTPDE